MSVIELQPVLRERWRVIYGENIGPLGVASAGLSPAYSLNGAKQCKKPPDIAIGGLN